MLNRDCVLLCCAIFASTFKNKTCKREKETILWATRACRLESAGARTGRCGVRVVRCMSSDEMMTDGLQGSCYYNGVL